ncbi:glutaredoxin grx [Perkinsela sp. CCAP 1560/4]|nr:glutaredoxin grx [Perkinsela sp. CCAP 1560/4]|eukprot:KNH03703.1 glutaredoxin grx [Perkinsela sp. CCAP 1560/4]
MSTAIKHVKNSAEFEEIKASNAFVVAHFYTEWCEPSLQLNKLLDEWIDSNRYQKVTIVAVDAEAAQEAVRDLSIEEVPTIVFFRKGTFVFHVKGAIIKQIEEAIERIFFAADAEEPLNKRIENIIKGNRVMIFLTGSPSMPQCGFTSRVCRILEKAKVEYGYFDIMTDAEVLHGLKKYSNWPTYPQLYVDGELVGGCDIITEADASGKLNELLGLPV